MKLKFPNSNLKNKGSTVNKGSTENKGSTVTVVFFKLELGNFNFITCFVVLSNSRARLVQINIRQFNMRQVVKKL